MSVRISKVKHRSSSSDEVPFLLRHDQRFKDNRILQAIVILYAIVWIVLAFHPKDRMEWLLEQILVVVFIGVFVVSYLFFQFTNFSYLLIALFLTVHTYGAHYSYENSPVDHWLQGMGYPRGGSDRLAHLFFGFLMVLPTYEFFCRAAKIRRGWSYLISILTIAGAGSLYEVGEMYVAFLAPLVGKKFVGDRGDRWDSYHDMELQIYGAILMVAIVFLVKFIRRKLAEDKVELPNKPS